MKISVTDAKGQLTELVRLAEAGEEVVLTRHGQDAARIIPVRSQPTQEERRRALEKAFAAGRLKASPGPSAERSQDFLYDKDGLPNGDGT
ncbi:MAG TPA: type II toxin-antitoxin system Phd/YefM family antitoxin [Caulobacterales bacterium]|jgi:prevent-host-death family protein|nr:type II toxin-antitoxin system Phd/YefM family antitoxin [Caulobacterales bacterium]